MSARIVLGLAVALVSSAAINLGFFVQHEAAATLGRLSVRRPFHSLRLLFTDRAWLIGNGAGLAGWALYVAALWLAPLSLVQATSAAGIAVLAVAVARSGTPLSRRDRAGVIAAAVGLLLLGASLVGARAGDAHVRVAPVLVWMAASAGAAAISRIAIRGGAGLGVAAGVMFAAGDVGTKAALAGHPWLWLPLLACYGLAFVALQTGFQAGGALATAGTASLLMYSLPIGAGIALFHEPLGAGAAAAARVLAFAFVVAGAVLLARGENQPARAPG